MTDMELVLRVAVPHVQLQNVLHAGLECAREVGHEYVDNYHCFSALLRTNGSEPTICAALSGRTATEVEDALWKRVETRPAQGHVPVVSPLLWYMIHATLTDLCAIGDESVEVFHLLMFFLYHPDCVPYGLFQTAPQEREGLLRRVIEVYRPRGAAILLDYYCGMHRIMVSTWSQRLALARLIPR